MHIPTTPENEHGDDTAEDKDEADRDFQIDSTDEIEEVTNENLTQVKEGKVADSALFSLLIITTSMWGLKRKKQKFKRSKKFKKRMRLLVGGV